MKRILFLSLIFIPISLGAQKVAPIGNDDFKPLAEHLSAFGQTIPQEKVYVHMDNTCYFQGDTIWFAAYTRQTSDGRPSRVSRVLYAELLNQDGYLVERKLIEMHEGRGNGFFALNNPIQYSGFYELRAYTRWQLNWGRFEHKHQPLYMGYKREALEHTFTDYEKLYSRVFPVYDKPQEKGNFVRDMTLRNLRRYYNKDQEKRKMRLQFFPEGGHLVAGVENRVAFEATMSDGEWLEGDLTPTQPHPLPLSGERGDSILTLNRGRGVFTIVPEAGREYEMTFTASDGQTVKAKLPRAETMGAAIQIKQDEDSVYIDAQLAGLSADSLALTVMHEGRVEEFIVHSAQCIVPLSRLRCGVNQVTLFDAAGRVYADRLFFVRKADEMQPTLSISTSKEQFAPYEAIELNIQGRAKDTPVSLTVRDRSQQDLLFDNASIMAEMLLSSEIRGFVPQPGWFFEKDDEEHRRALDLLMLTQGWRRFNWQDMAVRGQWDLTEPNEQTPLITGIVDNYQTGLLGGGISLNSTDIRTKAPGFDGNSQTVLKEETAIEESRVLKEVMQEENAPELKFEMDYITKSRKKNEALVHAEFVAGEERLMGEAETVRGKFRVKLPPFYGKGIFYIGAIPSKKRHKRYTWVQQKFNEEDVPRGLKNRIKFFVEDPELIVRVRKPYPRYVKPYTFQQIHFPDSAYKLGTPLELLAGNVHVLREVPVRTRRGGLRRFDDSQPVLIMDAYEAFNLAIDDDLTNGDYDNLSGTEVYVKQRISSLYAIEEAILYSWLGDIDSYGASSQTHTVRYGVSPTRRATDDKLRNIHPDSVYHPKYLKSLSWLGAEGGLDMPPGEMYNYDRLGKLDKVVLYTDYAPRLNGDKRYEGANGPQNIIAVYPYADGSVQPEYRDRRYLLDGFAYPAEFYNPDYSRQRPQEPTDYRRTLYWNPSLQLDEQGRAHVTLYNNCRMTQISVSAAGQAENGQLLWNK